MSGSADYDLTANFQFYKPIFDMDEDEWGYHWNYNADSLDALIYDTRTNYLPLTGGQIDGDLTVVPPSNWGGSYYQTMTIGSPSTQSPGLSFLSSNPTNPSIAFVRYGNSLYISCGAADGSNSFDIGFWDQASVRFYPPLTTSSINAGGPVTLSSDPTVAMHAATKQYVDSRVSDAPSDGDTYGRRSANWTQVLPLTGGNLSDVLTIDVPPNWTDGTSAFYSLGLTLGSPTTDAPGIRFVNNDPTTPVVALERYQDGLWLSAGTDTGWQADIAMFSVSQTFYWTNVAFQGNLDVYGPMAFHGTATLSADPVQPLEVATKQYVDAQAGGIQDAPSDGSAYGRVNAAWAQVLPLSGGIINGVLTIDPLGATWGSYQIGLKVGTTADTTSGMQFINNSSAAQAFAILRYNNGLWISYGSANNWVADVADFNTTGINFRRPLTMTTGNTITCATVPTTASHLANKAYVDDQIAAVAVAKTGDTMTGNLTVPFLNAQDGLSLSSYNAGEWYFYTDPASGDKYQTYRSGGGPSPWYDVFRGADGTREWWNAGTRMLRMGPGGRLFAYLGVAFDQSGLFYSFRDSTGSAVTEYGAGGDYDIWLGNTGDRVWMGSNTSLMILRNQGGDLEIAGTLVQGSDERGKTEIKLADQGLAEVMSIAPILYTRIGGDCEHLGFSAQQLQTALPHAVIERAPREGDPTRLGVDNTAVIAACVNAIKELANLSAAQNARLTRMEGMMH